MQKRILGRAMLAALRSPAVEVEFNAADDGFIWSVIDDAKLSDMLPATGLALRHSGNQHGAHTGLELPLRNISLFDCLFVLAMVVYPVPKEDRYQGNPLHPKREGFVGTEPFQECFPHNAREVTAFAYCMGTLQLLLYDAPGRWFLRTDVEKYDFRFQVWTGTLLIIWACLLAIGISSPTIENDIGPGSPLWASFLASSFALPGIFFCAYAYWRARKRTANLGLFFLCLAAYFGVATIGIHHDPQPDNPSTASL